MLQHPRALRFALTAAWTLVSAGPSAQTPPSPSSTDAASKAPPTYKTMCVMCHGLDGGGDTAAGRSLKVPDLRTSLGKKSDADLASVITDGKEKMPPFKGRVSKEEVQGLVTYLRSLAPKP